MSEPGRPPVEITWLWRRIFTYLASLANAGLLAAVILKVRDPQGLAALGLALVFLRSLVPGSASSAGEVEKTP